jgi:hypothetical protein
MLLFCQISYKLYLMVGQRKHLFFRPHCVQFTIPHFIMLHFWHCKFDKSEYLHKWKSHQSSFKQLGKGKPKWALERA